ncbi:MAG: hypothetical protein V4438_01895, partial [Patescibacteria group bacterium]
NGPFYDSSTSQYYITFGVGLGDKISATASSNSVEAGQGTIFGRSFKLYTDDKGYTGCDGNIVNTKPTVGYMTLNPLEKWSYGGKADNTAEALKLLGINPDGTDRGNRAYLDYNGVGVNKAAHPGSTDSTEMDTLSSETLNKIIALKNASGLPDCSTAQTNCLVVTGGTEIGHKAHGKGKQVVDIRKVAALNDLIINTAGKNISVNSIGNITYYTTEGDFAGAYTNELVGGSAAHWHIEYGKAMPAPAAAPAVKKVEAKKSDTPKKVEPKKDDSTPQNPKLPLMNERPNAPDATLFDQTTQDSKVDDAPAPDTNPAPAEEVRRAEDPLTGKAFPDVVPGFFNNLINKFKRFLLGI